VGIVYDCFGAGRYRNRSELRHRHKDAFVQISNELATKGLCSPLLYTGVAAPIRVKNSQPFQKAYILEHSFFTSHNLDFIVLERIKMMYGIMR
jgi:hypothetical protein